MQSCIVSSSGSSVVVQVTPVQDSVCINAFLLDKGHVKDYARVFEMFFTDSIANRMKAKNTASIKNFVSEELYNYLFRFASGQTIDVFTDSEFLVQSLQTEFPLITFHRLDSGHTSFNFDLSVPDFIEEESGPSSFQIIFILGTKQMHLRKNLSKNLE